jgi:hypothetical protein
MKLTTTVRSVRETEESPEYLLKEVKNLKDEELVTLDFQHSNQEKLDELILESLKEELDKL